MKAAAGDSDRAWCKAVANTTAYNAELEYSVRRRGPFYLDPNTGAVQMASTRLLPHVSHVNSSLGYFETEALRPPLSRRALAADKPSQLPPSSSSSQQQQQQQQGPKKRGRKPMQQSDQQHAPQTDTRPPKLLMVPSEPVCPVCKALCDVGGVTGLTCTLCLNSYHSRCVDLNESQARAAKASGFWQCNWCKVCVKCTLGNDEDLCVLCDNCDSAHHIYCLRPKLRAVPTGAWRCDRCVQCVSCGARSSPAWWDGYTLCSDCHFAIQRGDSCPVCKLAHVDESLPAIICDTCDKWVHVNGRCEAPTVMTPELWSDLHNNAAPFQCSWCQQHPQQQQQQQPQTAASGGAGDDDDDEAVQPLPLDVDVDALLEEEQRRSGHPLRPLISVVPSAAEENLVCPQCQRRFTAHTSLVRHLRTVHRAKRRRGGSDDDDDSPNDDSDDSFAGKVTTTTSTTTASGTSKPSGTSWRSSSGPVPCEECGRVFPNLQAKSSHITLKHRRNRKKDD